MSPARIRIRILHVDNSPAVTGAYKALLSWCLSAPEFDHVWVLPEHSAVAAEVGAHFTVYMLPFTEIGRSPRRLLAYLPALIRNGRRLAAIIRRENAGILHANDLYNLVPYAARFSGRLRLPLLVHARMLRRSFPGRIYDAWVRWHLKRADDIVAVSEAIRNDWGNTDRVRLIYDPIAVTEHLPPYRFQPAAGGPFRFLYLANYIRGKGQEDALAAVKALRDQGITDFRVDFHGGTMGLEKNDHFKKSLQDFIATHNLDGMVTLHGPSDNVEALMKDHHALLHFSHAESFGMVCYEALYYGLPVISSDCGGPAEMMQPGKTGLLRPVGDVAGFASDMQRLIENPALCASLSAGSAAFIRARFTGGGDALSEVFRQLTRLR